MKSAPTMFLLCVLMVAACQSEHEYEPPARASDLRVQRLSGELAGLGLAIDTSELRVQVRSIEDAAHELVDDRWQSARWNAAHQLIAKAFSETLTKDGASQRFQPASPFDQIHAQLSQGAAYYSPPRRAIVLLDGRYQATSRDRLVAHELVHAHQDQRPGGLPKFQRAPTTERAKMKEVLYEGHAELTAIALMLRRKGRDLSWLNLSGPRSRLRGQVGAIPLKYSLGMRFLLARLRKGSFSLAGHSYAPMPRSTEQMLHPEKYGRDTPVRVSLPTWPSDTDGATLDHEDVFGELAIYELLLLSAAPQDAFVAATGWDGDRITVWKTKHGMAFMWRIVFDRPIDAEQFKTVVSKPDGALSVSRRGRTIDIVYAEHRPLIAMLGRAMQAHATVTTPVVDDQQTTTAAESQWERVYTATLPVVRGKRWHHDTLGVSLPVPSGWRAISRGKHALVRYGKQTMLGGASVSQEPNYTGETLDEMTATFRAAVDQLPDVKLVFVKRQVISGQQVSLIRWDGVPPGLPDEMINYTVMYARNKSVQTISVMVPVTAIDADSEDDVGEQAKRIIDGIQFNEPRAP